MTDGKRMIDSLVELMRELRPPWVDYYDKAKLVESRYLTPETPILVCGPDPYGIIEEWTVYIHPDARLMLNAGGVADRDIAALCMQKSVRQADPQAP